MQRGGVIIVGVKMRALLAILTVAMSGAMTVFAQPNIFTQPTNQSVLVGSRVLITAGVAGVGPLTFQWQLNGTNLPNNLITTVAGNGTAGFAGDGGIATTGEVYTPYGVAADSAGNVLIADTVNAHIRKVDTNGIMTTVAGKSLPGYSGDGGAATNASLHDPNGVAVDTGGNVFIADTANYRIRKVDTNGIITTVAGNGSPVFSGDGGAATNAGLNYPRGVALDANGNLFIADTSDNRVRKVDTNGFITTVAGKSGSGFSGDGGAATNASLNSPRGVALDGAGNLFIADYANCRVRKIDTYGVITTIAGDGSGTYSGDGGLATNAGLVPYGVSVDAYGDVFVADNNNNRIRQVDPYGIITTVAGTNLSGFSGDGEAATNARLYQPRGLAMDSYGRTLIADTSNNRIRRFGQGPILVLDRATAANAGDYTLVVSSSFGSVTSAVATLTVLLPPAIVSPPANQTAGLGSNATFTVAATGTAPLAYQWLFNGTNLPNQTSQSLNLTNVQWSDGGNYSVIITNNYGSVTSSVVTLTVGWPPSVASQPTNLMVAVGNTALLSVGAAGDGPFSYQWQFNGTNLPPIVITVAGSGSIGFSGDGGAATNAKLNSPYGVAVDGRGNVFFADSGNFRIRRVDTNGIISTVVGTGTAGYSGDGGQATNATLRLPEGMAFDQCGNLFFADFNNAVVRRVDTNGIITKIAGAGGLGYSYDGGPATNAILFGTTAVAVDANGNVFLTDYYSYRIRKVGTNGVITTVAGITGAGIVGGYSGDGGLATNANLGQPTGVALDSFGNIFISDADNYRVRMVNTNGIITTVAGGGSDYYSNGIPGTNAHLYPINVAVDPWNNVFISCDNRVRRLDTNGIITTVAGGGSSRPGDYGPAINASLAAQAMAFDAQGNLFIAERSWARIRKVCFSGLPVWLVLNANTNSIGAYSVIVSSPFGSIASSNATLTVISPPVIGPTLMNADGSVTLNLSSTPDVSSRLYAATNLNPPVVWQPIYTNPVGGAWQFTDTNALDQPVRFYRVSTP